MLALRGAEVLAGADVVVYDRLSVGAVLDMASAAAERINVGKMPGQPRMSQEEINQLLVEHGRAGRQVVRLKGGDPLVFARGGEEAAALAEAGVDFEIIPGITSAFAAPAYAGIPVTLRHSSTSVTVITGHEAPNAKSSVNWDAAAQLGGTLVILMGVARWDAIAERLLAAGMSPDTPAAAVCWGTRPTQRTTRATLATLGEHPLEAPSVIVVGEVAAQELEWFEKRPLFGKRVVVTRPAAQNASLCDMLARAGAEPIPVPLIEIVSAAEWADAGLAAETEVDGREAEAAPKAIARPTDAGQPPFAEAEIRTSGASLKVAAERLGDYDWVILTSANGARALLSAINDARDFGKAKVAAIGPATAEVLKAANIRPDLVPSSYIAEALLEELLGTVAAAAKGETAMGETPRTRALIARAAVARDVLPEGLRAAGWEVDVVEAYRTEGLEVSDAARAEIASSDVITFASPSAVEQFVKTGSATEIASGDTSADIASISGKLAAYEEQARPECPTAPIVACIGPITAAAARKLGLEVTVEAAEHTARGLVEALERHFAN